MATSGSKTTYYINGQYGLNFQWEVVSQSAVDNTSTVNWKYTFYSYRAQEWYDDTSVNFYWTVEIDGQEFSGSRTVLYRNYSTVIKRGTVTIQHDSDGTKTFDFKYYLDTDGNHWSSSGTGELNQILRASSLTAANGTLGTAQTLTITPQDATYKHKIQYTCGSASGYAAGSASAYASGTSISWTPPLALAKQNTTGTSVSVTLKLITYTSDGTELGSASKIITCTIPASVKPSVSLAVSDLTDNFSTFGKYVQSKSKLKIVLTASGSQGSSITAYKTTADGSSYTAATIETDVIKGSGTLTISATVTDSRGRTATASTTISVYAYEPPALDHISAQRVNADGTANSSGEHLLISFDAAITSMDSKNTATYTLLYKKSSETSYTTAILSDYSNQYTVSGGLVGILADTASSYDIIIKAADHYSAVQRSCVGSSAQKVFSILKHGKGIALNKVAEEEGVFDVNFQSYFRGGLKHPSLADGVNLNSITTPNTYNGRAGGGYSNCPVTADFTLEVLTAGTGSLIIQRLTDFATANTVSYHRFYDGAWSDWEKVEPLHLKKITDDEHLIANGDDLNSYTTPGVYRCATATIAASLKNANSEYSSAGFRLIVSETSSNIGVIQTAIYNTITGRIYWRILNSDNEWSNWFKILTTNDITTKATSLNEDVLKLVSTATTVTLTANGYISQQTITPTAVSGYTLIAPVHLSSNSSYTLCYHLYYAGGKLGFSVRNLRDAEVTATITIYALYAKTS